MARENMVSAKKNPDRMEQGFTETLERLRKTVAALNKAFRIIAPSPVLARRYAEAGVGRITVIPHGIVAPGADVIDKNKYCNRTGTVVRFAYIGGILQIKGIHVLIDAFNRLGSAEAQLLIYGHLGFDPVYDKQLQGKATDQRIRFMGAFDHKDVFTVLRGIDVVVMPSLVAENYPLVANEAFMARTPVVASDVGGLNQLIDHGRNGFLFEKGNVGALAGILATIVNDPGMLSKLSDNIAPVKNIVEHAAEIEALYSAAIAAKAV
jgi:glycosyltransferase involved in cell wall biosynthesis